MQQTGTALTIALNRLIDRLLETCLDDSDSNCRACYCHIGDTEPRRYEVTNSVVATKWQAGPTPAGRPLSDWDALLPALAEGLCSMQRISSRADGALHDCFRVFGATGLLACPAIDDSGRLVGAVFMLWNRQKQPPDADGLRRLMAEGMRVAGQIATVLNLGLPNRPGDLDAPPIA